MSIKQSLPLENKLVAAAVKSFAGYFHILNDHQKCFSFIEKQVGGRVWDQKSGSNASESTSSVREKHSLQKAEKFNLGKSCTSCTSNTVLHPLQCTVHSALCSVHSAQFTVQCKITFQYYTMSFSAGSFTLVHYNTLH